MLINKADLIERYILDMLAQNGGDKVELKRTDLAGEISCAPSQVSYVLSTRFTNSRGFQVESQRGLGGYIRITILKEENNADEENFQQNEENFDTQKDYSEKNDANEAETDFKERRAEFLRTMLNLTEDTDMPYDYSKKFMDYMREQKFITDREWKIISDMFDMVDFLIKYRYVEPDGRHHLLKQLFISLAQLD